tara:strand:- start:25 stop:459 length:435 start_codon:yes stop_codon:yes gene_type:complete
MSYFDFHVEKPQIAVISGSLSGNVSVGSAITFAEESGDTFNNINNLNVQGNTLYLSHGHWLLRGYLGIDNNDNLSNNCEYSWYVDNVQKGNKGATVVAGLNGTDPAQLEMSVTSSNCAVKLKFTSSNGTTTVSSDHTSIVIMRV